MVSAAGRGFFIFTIFAATVPVSLPVRTAYRSFQEALPTWGFFILKIIFAVL